MLFRSNRTVQEVKHLLSKQNAKFAEQNSLAWNFEKVGVVAFDAAENVGKGPDDIEIAIMESGARDFSKNEGEYRVTTEFKDLEVVRKNLESTGIKIRESGHDYQAKNTVMAENDEVVERLLEALLDHDDVQEVYTNLQ